MNKLEMVSLRACILKESPKTFYKHSMGWNPNDVIKATVKAFRTVFSSSSTRFTSDRADDEVREVVLAGDPELPRMGFGDYPKIPVNVAKAPPN